MPTTGSIFNYLWYIRPLYRLLWRMLSHTTV